MFRSYDNHHDHHHHDHHRRQRHGGFGPDFGFGGGGGFGPRGRGFGGPGGPGGRRRRGDVRLGILLLLKEDGPANGYQLIQGLSARTDGMWTPSPGSVYPTLSQLQDEGLITGVTQEGSSGTTFTLTQAGETHLDELGEVRAPWEPVEGGEEHMNFRRAIGGMVRAAAQVAKENDPATFAKALEILNGARRDLYRLLAEDDG
jgi:DNA-binding PadR family transcriptional regulator